MQADSSFQEMMQRYNREIARMYERSRQGPAPQTEAPAADTAEPPAAESPAVEPAAEKPVSAGEAEALPAPADTSAPAPGTAEVLPGMIPVQDMTLSEALSVLMRYRTLDKAGRLSLARGLAVELAQIALEMCSGVIDLLCREDPDLDEEGT